MKINKLYILLSVLLIIACSIFFKKYNLIVEKKDLNSLLLKNYEDLDNVQFDNAKFVTPYDFGAVGDGITDDSEAFKKLFEYENIYIPEGVFLLKCENKNPNWLDEGENFSIEGYFKVKSNTTIIGADKAVIKVKPNDYKAYNVIVIKNVENVKILGLNIVGDRDEHYSDKGEFGFGIFIADSKNVLIMNSKFSNLWGDGININTINSAKMNTEIFIKGCIFENNRRQGMSIESCDGAIIEDCTFNNTNGTLPESGVDIEPSHESMYVKNIIFNKCTFTNNNRIGLLIDGQYGDVSGVEVNNCFFYGNKEKGQIYITKARDIKINVYNGDSEEISVNENDSNIFTNNSINIKINEKKVRVNILMDKIKDIISRIQILL